MRPRRLVLAAASFAAVTSLAALAACRDDPAGPTGAPATPPALSTTLARIACAADAEAGTLECGPAASGLPEGARGDLILGGQGTYVELAAGAITVGSDVFSAPVTIRNLTAQPMATPDGATPDAAGVRVFFHAGPTNGVTVDNSDGASTFTASGQPYHEYSQGTGRLGGDGILANAETSAAKSWDFRLNGATSFTFEVFAVSVMPDEDGVLRWLVDRESLTDADLRGVWSGSSTEAWAAGFSGTIAHTADGGETWSLQTSPTASHFEGVAGAGTSDLWAFGSGGAIVHTTNGGASWATQASATGQTLTGGWAASASEAWIVGTNATILHTTDAGSNWTGQTAAETAHFRAVWGASSTTLWAVGDAGKIQHTTDGGTTWSAQASGTGSDLNAVWGASTSELWAVGSNGTILHTADGGANWSAQTSGTFSRLYAVWGASASELWAAGETGTLLHTTDGGANWTAVNAPTRVTLRSLSGTSATQVLAVGFPGLFLKRDASGWSVSDQGRALVAVWAGSGGEVWAVGSDGMVHRFDGSTWSLMEKPTTTQIGDVWGTSATNVYVASGFDIWRWNGGAWTKDHTASSGINALWGSSASDVYAVGSSGGAVHYDGTSWTDIGTGVSEHLNDVWGVADGTDDDGDGRVEADAVFAAGTNGTIVRALPDQQAGAFGWSVQPTPVTTTLRGIWAASTGDAWAVGSGGETLRWDGSTWSQASSGTASTLRSVWGSATDDVVAVGNGVVLHFDGTSWSEQAPGQASTFCGVGGRGPADVWLADCGNNRARVHHGTR